MRIAILLLAVTLISCGDPLQTELSEPSKNQTKNPETPGNPTDNPNPGTSKNTICYSKSCFNLIDAKSTQSSDYDYHDPFSDPYFPRSLDPKLYIKPARLVPVFAEHLNKVISANFEYGEFLSPRKGSFGILQKKALKKIQLIRTQSNVPIIITSGYRSPVYNSSVGGKRYSRHQYGDGLDFFSPDTSLNNLKKLCYQNTASFVQVYESHIHCDWRKLQQDFHFFDIGDGPSLDRLSIYSKLSSKIKIYARVIDNIISFEAQNVYKEDGEALVYSWTIQTPDGEVVESSDIKPELNFVPGKYKISVTAGETLSSSQEIIMN